MDLKRWLRTNPDRAAAWICVAAGALVLLLRWAGASNTAYTAEQMPFIISGGIGGALLVAMRRHPAHLRRSPRRVAQARPHREAARPPPALSTTARRGRARWQRLVEAPATAPSNGRARAALAADAGPGPAGLVALVARRRHPVGRSCRRRSRAVDHRFVAGPPGGRIRRSDPVGDAGRGRVHRRRLRRRVVVAPGPLGHRPPARSVAARALAGPPLARSPLLVSGPGREHFHAASARSPPAGVANRDQRRCAGSRPAALRRVPTMISQIFAAIVTGLGTGSVFAIAGMGLVVTNKTSGIFNFAHGTQAAAGAFDHVGALEDPRLALAARRRRRPRARRDHRRPHPRTDRVPPRRQVHRGRGSSPPSACWSPSRA